MAEYLKGDNYRYIGERFGDLRHFSLDMDMMLHLLHYQEWLLGATSSMQHFEFDVMCFMFFLFI